MARFFDINIEEIEGLHRMQISGFNNYDEARQYANAVYQQASIKRLLDKVHAYVISEENLKLLGTSHTYEEYEKFYTKHFAPLEISKFPLLTEPIQPTSAAEETSEETSSEKSKAAPSTEINTLEIPAVTPPQEKMETNEEVITGNKKEIPTEDNNGIEIIMPSSPKEKEDDGTFVIPNKKEEKKENDTRIYFDDSNSSESIELEDEYYELEGF